MDKFQFKFLIGVALLCLWLKKSNIPVLILQTTQPLKYFYNFKYLLIPIR